MEQCIINVSLNEESGPIWFLGDPKKLKASLSFKNKGPIAIDFFCLDQAEQLTLLSDWKDEKIVVDKDYSQFIQQWKERNQKLINSVREAQAKNIPQKTTNSSVGDKSTKPLSLQQTAKLKLAAELEEKERQFRNRVAILSTASVRGLKNALSKETDLKLIRTLIKLEEEKLKPRKKILEALADKQKKLFTEVLEKSNQLKGNDNFLESDIEVDVSEFLEITDEETDKEVVIESDVGNFSLSEKTLAEFAAGGLLK